MCHVNRLLSYYFFSLLKEYEIIWSKVKTKNNKDMIVVIYMPHLNQKDLKNLDSSLKKLSEHCKSKNIILA